MFLEIGGLILMLAVLAGVIYWRLEKEGFIGKRENAENTAKRLLENIGRSNLEIRQAGTVIEAMQTEINMLSSSLRELRRMAFAEMDGDKKKNIEAALINLEKGDPIAAAAVFEAEFEDLKSEMKKAGDSYRELRRKAAQAACNVGIVQYINDTPLSLAAFIQAAEYDPDNPAIWSMLGLAWMRLGELDNAETLLRRAFNLPKDHDVKSDLASDLAKLGNVYAGREDFGKACDFWQRARSLYAGTGMDEKLEKVDRLMRDASCSTDRDGEIH